MADLPSDLNRKTSNQAELATECEEIEGAIMALRATYEQYFLGLDRHPPTQAHATLKKRVNRLQSTFAQQTATKFKIQSLHNKFLTYERLWIRTLQEMENGTYRRDLFKAKLHSKQREQPAAPKPAPAAVAPAGGPATPSAKAPPAPPLAPNISPLAAAPAAPRAAVAAAAPAAPRAEVAAVLPGALSEAKLKAIYDAYVVAKKRCNEDVSRLSFDSLATTLKRQVPELMKQHKAKSIEFKVVIKDGKAVLKAVPRE